MSEKENKDFDILDVAAQVSKFIEKNFKIFLGVFGGLLVAGVVWTFMAKAAKEKEQSAFAELYKITKVYDKKKEDFSEAKREKESKNKNKDPKVQEDTTEKKNLLEATGDLEKDYGTELKQLEAFVQTNLGKNASGEAALVLSEIYDQYGKADKGAEVLGQTLAKWNEKNVLYYVMQMRSGDLWASIDQCDKAVSYWQVVADSKSFIARQAQLKLGVCLQKIGRIDEAKTWFKKITDKDPNSSEGFSAKRYLRFLEFKTKAGEEDSQDKAQTTAPDKDKKS